MEYVGDQLLLGNLKHISGCQSSWYSMNKFKPAEQWIFNIYLKLPPQARYEMIKEKKI